MVIQNDAGSCDLLLQGSNRIASLARLLACMLACMHAFMLPLPVHKSRCGESDESFMLHPVFRRVVKTGREA